MTGWLPDQDVMDQVRFWAPWVAIGATLIGMCLIALFEGRDDD
jgi:hypothetical protein